MTMKADGEKAEAPGHAEEGEKIVAGANFPLAVVAAVRHHHDRWDAGGKADGLMGSDIPILARILAVAERFEASTAGRGCVRVTPKAAQDQQGAGGRAAVAPAVGRACSPAD